MPDSPADRLPYVFLSYASVDRERALQIADALEGAGISVWIDRQAIAGGTSWGSEIVDGIKGCGALLICCSVAAMASRNVRQEIQLAWRYERAYLPLLLEPVDFPEQVQYFLEGWQWVDLAQRSPGDWLPAVVKALSRLGIAAQRAGSPDAVLQPVPVQGATLPERATPEAERFLADEQPAGGPAATVAIPPAPSTSPFVGRQAEFAVLTGALDQAAAGRGRIVLLAGEPGIGKTRLARGLADAATERGCLVLWGRCWEGEGAPAFWPWIEALGAYARGQEPDQLRAQLGAAAPDLAQLVPEIRALLTDVPEPSPGAPEYVRFRLFGGVAATLKLLAAARPVLLVFDDLHWADKPSLALLQFLAREIEAAKLLIVGTYRDTDLDRQHPLGEALVAMRREPAFERVHLSGLTEPEIATLLAERAGAALDAGGRTLAAALHRETEGNPFFVGETLRHLTETGKLLQRDGRLQVAGGSMSDLGLPEGVRELIGRRLSRLPEASNQLLGIAAVMGREFDVEVLERVSGRTGDEVDEALAAAEAAVLVTETGGAAGRYRFSHALVRETLVQELQARRRVRLHRQIAEALEVRYAARAELHAAELAYHFGEAAGSDAAVTARAIHYGRLAAAQAEAGTAWEEAARLYEQCLVLLTEAENVAPGEEAVLLEAAGRCRRNAAEIRAGWRHLMRAIDRFRASSDSIGVARATLEAAQINAPPGRLQALLSEALAVLGDKDPRLQALLLVQTNTVFAAADSLDGSLARAGALAQEHGFADIAARVQAHNGVRLAYTRHYAEAITALFAARDSLLSDGGPAEALYAYRPLSRIVYESGDLTAGDAITREGRELASRLHMRTFEGPFVGVLSSARQARGDLAGCAALLAEMHMDDWSHDLLRATLATLRGDLTGALDLLPEPDRGGAGAPGEPAIFAGRAGVRFRCGDSEGAIRELADWTRTLEQLPQAMHLNPFFLFTTFWADEALPVLGDEAVVRRIYDRFNGWPEVRYEQFTGRSFDQFIGALALRLGEIDAAERHFNTGLAWAEREHCPIEQGRCLQGLAEIELGRGNRGSATHLLDRASALFEQSGAVYFLRQALTAREALSG